MPPISAMCAIVAAKATSSPSWKTGFEQHVLGHVAAAAVRVVVEDDVARRRTPRRRAPRATQRDRVRDRAELRRVELGPARSCSPARSKMAHEKSRDSLKIGE